jgi:hypothetical protein
MTMQASALILWVKRRVHTHVRLIDKLLDLPGIPARAVRQMEIRRVIVVHLQRIKGGVILYIAFVQPLLFPRAISTMDIFTASEVPSGGNELISVIISLELFQDEETGETLDSDDRSLIDLVRGDF